MDYDLIRSQFGLEGMTNETIEGFTKSLQQAWLTTLGVQGVDLEGLVSLVPVETPARNLFPRTTPNQGAKFMYWRALLNVNGNQSDVAVGYDYAGNLMEFDEQDVYAPFVPLAKANRVTQDAIDTARNYAEAMSISVLQTLNQGYIGEDRHIVGGLAFPLPAIGTPTGTVDSLAGTIAPGASVSIKVAARSGTNYFYGGSGIGSSAYTPTIPTTVPSTGGYEVVASVPAVKCAVAYDWYVNGFFYTTTTVNTVTISFVPTANQPLPTGIYALPDMYNVAPVGPAPTVDTSVTHDLSGNVADFNGVIATYLGDYGASSLVTPGSGTNSGAYYSSNDGAPLTVRGQGIKELDEINLYLHNSVKLSPTAYMVNAQQMNDIAELMSSTGIAQTFYQPDDSGQRVNVIAGTHVIAYTNKSRNNAVIPFEVHPSVPPGTIIARTDRVPFPGANITNVFEVACQRDWSQFNYAAAYLPGTQGGGPRNDYEVRSIETLVNRAPSCGGVISNVGSLQPIP